MSSGQFPGNAGGDLGSGAPAASAQDPRGQYSGGAQQPYAGQRRQGAAEYRGQGAPSQQQAGGSRGYTPQQLQQAGYTQQQIAAYYAQQQAAPAAAQHQPTAAELARYYTARAAEEQRQQADPRLAQQGYPPRGAPGSGFYPPQGGAPRRPVNPGAISSQGDGITPSSTQQQRPSQLYQPAPAPAQQANPTPEQWRQYYEASAKAALLAYAGTARAGQYAPSANARFASSAQGLPVQTPATPVFSLQPAAPGGSTPGQATLSLQQPLAPQASGGISQQFPRTGGFPTQAPTQGAQADEFPLQAQGAQASGFPSQTQPQGAQAGVFRTQSQAAQAGSFQPQAAPGTVDPASAGLPGQAALASQPIQAMSEPAGSDGAALGAGVPAGLGGGTPTGLGAVTPAAAGDMTTAPFNPSASLTSAPPPSPPPSSPWSLSPPIQGVAPPTNPAPVSTPSGADLSHVSSVSSAPASASSAPTGSPSKTLPLPLIIGGVAGGIVFILLATLLVVKTRSYMSRRKDRALADFNQAARDEWKADQARAKDQESSRRRTMFGGRDTIRHSAVHPIPLVHERDYDMEGGYDAKPEAEAPPASFGGQVMQFFSNNVAAPILAFKSSLTSDKASGNESLRSSGAKSSLPSTLRDDPFEPHYSTLELDNGYKSVVLGDLINDDDDYYRDESSRPRTPPKSPPKTFAPYVEPKKSRSADRRDKFDSMYTVDTPRADRPSVLNIPSAPVPSLTAYRDRNASPDTATSYGGNRDSFRPHDRVNLDSIYTLDSPGVRRTGHDTEGQTEWSALPETKKKGWFS